MPSSFAREIVNLVRQTAKFAHQIVNIAHIGFNDAHVGSIEDLFYGWMRVNMQDLLVYVFLKESHVGIEGMEELFVGWMFVDCFVHVSEAKVGIVVFVLVYVGFFRRCFGGMEVSFMYVGFNEWRIKDPKDGWMLVGILDFFNVSRVSQQRRRQW